MSDDLTHSVGSDPKSLDGQIDAVCDRVEAMLRAGSAVRIEDFLDSVPEAGRRDLLRELIALEVEYRVKAQQQPAPEEYRGRFPDYAEEVQAAFGTVSKGNRTQAYAPKRPADEPKALKIRCPHCRNPIELVEDKPLSEVVCPSCGSSFGVVGDEALAHRTQGGTLRRRQQFGHFELLEQLGAGAFGAVWKARDTQLDRIVALKIPRRGQLTEEEAEKFIREARAAAQLRHPNIISVHEVGREGDTLYIVSDFVEGLTLADTLTAQKPGYREAAELCAKIAEALDYAHERGVIHRDLKPSNILIDRSGEPCLMDFGLAKRESGEITMTVEGEILGTPAYMSPEQARGEGHTVDRRTDIYSLGAMLFGLLTGECPFRGNVRMLLKQVVEDEPPRPRKLDSHIPRDLETICLKCLEKSPGSRYATAGDLAEELRRYLRGEEITARPISRAARLWRWCRRNPMMAGLVTAVSASLLVGVTVSTYFAIESSHRADENLKLAEREATARLEADGQRDEAEQQRKEAEKQRKEAGRNADMARRHLYVAHMNLAQNAWDGASVAAMLDFLDRCRPRDGQEDLRGFEWYYWDRRCHGDLLTLEGIGTVNSVAFTPDAKRLVSAGMSATKVWDMATGREVFTLDVSAEHHSATGAAFSPDGTRLATASFTDKVIKVWDMATGREVLTFRGHTDWVRSVAFSPDGRRLASGADRTVRLWDATTGQEIQSFKADFRQVLSVAFSPDGKRVATADITGIKVWDAATGREIMNVRADEGTVQSLAFSPDGKRLASGNYGQTVIVRDATTGQAALTLRGHKGAVQSVAFSQDGKYLASGSGDGTLKLWDAGTGQEMSTFKGHTGEVRAVAFSPDGRRLASAGDHTVKLWDTAAKPWDAERSREAAMRGQGEFLATTLAVSRDGNRLALALATGVVELRDVVTGEEILKLDGGGQQITSLAFSPDGTRLAWPSADHTVTIRDTATGKEILTFRGHKEDVGCVAFGADGKRLASVSSESLRIWDTTTGREALAVTGQPMFQSMAFSPDGKRVASSCVFEVLIWDAATGEKILTLKGHRDFVPSVAFGPDGKQLASASADGTIRVWDTATGQEIFALEAHAMGCKQVVFSPDGRRLASAGRDKTVKLWDMMTGLEILTLKTGREEANRLVFAPDGNWLVSASFEGLRLWDARPRSAANPLLPDPEQVSLAERASLLEKRISLLMKRLPGAKKVMDGGVLASWSPDAKELAVVERKGICVIDVATGLRRGLVDSGVFPAWQPKDGRWIAFVRFNQKTPWLVPELWLVEAAGGSARKLADGGRPSWSSDGETLYFHSPKQRQVVAIQPEKADAKPAAVFETAWPYPAVSGDGNRIAFCPADAGSSESSFRVTRNSVLVCDRGAGKTLIESSLPGGEKGLLLSAFSPDGKKLAFGFADSRGLWILDVEKGTKWKALDGPYAAPCWSPDGSKFAFHLCAKERQETWIVDAKVLDGLKPSEPK